MKTEHREGNYKRTKRDGARAKKISGQTTQRRNVICCSRKTIEESVMENGKGHEDQNLDGSELKRVRRKYECFLHDASGRGNNFNHSRRSFDVLWGYLRIPLVREVAIRSGNRTLFPSPAFTISACVSCHCLVFLQCLKHGAVCAYVQSILSRLRVVWGSRKYRGRIRERKESRHGRQFDLIVSRSWSK